MKLIPEQVVGLRKAIIEKRKCLDGYMDYLDDNRTTSPDDVTSMRLGDLFTENSFFMDRDDYTRFTDIMADFEVVDNPNLEQIDIGTRFTVVYDGEDEESVLTLVETAQFISLYNGFVSIDSPLGRAARGCKEGDHCSFKVNNRTIGLTIKSIDKNKNNYLRTINSVKKSDRCCKAASVELKEAIESGDVKKQEELKAITHSQLSLLKSEYGRLEREARRNKNFSIINRMSSIKKTLDTRKVVYPRKGSDVIELGTIFSVKLQSDTDTMVFENVELINCAVSDEYSFEYIEKIGAIGYAVAGLREGESFKVRIGNKRYTGVVYNINNTYGSLLERSNRK